MCYIQWEIRKSYGQKDIAVYCFKKIIKLGVRRIADGEHSRGVSFAKELINDSKFEWYCLYHEDNPKQSKRYFSMYKSGLKNGTTTIYKPLRKFLLD